jgi:outer membrane protein
MLLIRSKMQHSSLHLRARLVQGAMLGYLVCGAMPAALAQPLRLSYSLGEEKNIPQTPLRALPSGKQEPVQRSPGSCDLPSLDQTLALSDAVMTALCRNPQTRQAWATAMVQAADVGGARSAYLPTLTASLGRNRDSQSNAIPVTLNTRSATLNYVLWDFGLRAANLEAAQQSLAAALSSQDAVLQTVFATATAAYYDALTGQAALQAAQLAENAAQTSMNAAAARQAQGVGTPTDALQARAAYSKAVLERVKAEGAALAARGALAFAMGLDAQTSLLLPSDLLDDLTTLQSSEFLTAADKLIDEAKMSHPSILAAKAQLKAAQARVDSAQAEGRPSIAVSTSRYLNGRTTTSLVNAAAAETTVGIVMTIPLFEGFGRAAKVNAARARAEGKVIELAGAELQVSLDVWKAYQDLQTQTSALDASRDLLESATLAAKALEARYRVGASGIVDLLNAQSAQSNAQQQRILTLGNWRAARLKLLGSLGQLGLWAVDG